MNGIDKKRFVKSLEYAIEHVEKEAKYFCYADEFEYLDIMKKIKKVVNEAKKNPVCERCGRTLRPDFVQEVDGKIYCLECSEVIIAYKIMEED